MRPLALVLVLFALAAPAAAAEKLQANVVSWSPNIVRPGEPVSVVLQLARGPSPLVPDDTSVAGASDVHVVLHGRGETLRFTTTKLGSGRFSAQIVFPKAGAWALRAGYRPGRHRALDEVLLGKGAACVGDCVGGESSRARRDDRVVVVALVLLSLSLVAISARARARARTTRTRPG